MSTILHSSTTTPALHLKISSKLNNKIAKIYREQTDFCVHIFDLDKPNKYDPSDKGIGYRLIQTYFLDNETEAIEVAQLALSAM